MPPSGFIATSAAGGSTWRGIVGNHPQARQRQVAGGRKAGGDLAFHVHRQRAGRVVKAGLGFGLFDDHVAAEELALMGVRQPRQQPDPPGLMAIPRLCAPVSIWSAITTSPTFRCGDRAPARPMEITPRMSPCRALSLSARTTASPPPATATTPATPTILGFFGQTGDGENRHSPNSTRRELPVLRLR